MQTGKTEKKKKIEPLVVISYPGLSQVKVITQNWLMDNITASPTSSSFPAPSLGKAGILVPASATPIPQVRMEYCPIHGVGRRGQPGFHHWHELLSWTVMGPISRLRSHLSRLLPELSYCSSHLPCSFIQQNVLSTY